MVSSISFESVIDIVTFQWAVPAKSRLTDSGRDKTMLIMFSCTAYTYTDTLYSFSRSLPGRLDHVMTRNNHSSTYTQQHGKFYIIFISNIMLSSISFESVIDIVAFLWPVFVKSRLQTLRETKQC